VTEDDLWRSSFVHSSGSLPETAVAKDPRRDQLKLFVPPIAFKARRKLLHLDENPAQQLIPQTWDDFGPAARRVQKETGFGWPDLLNAMDDADVVLIHGASLHAHGNTIIQRTILFLAYLAKTLYATPVVLANHTADPSTPDILLSAQNVYPMCDDVIYRDPISAERWSAVLGGRFAPDSAFWFEPAPRELWVRLAGRPTYFDVWPDEADFDPARPYVCLGGSSIFHERRDWGSLLAGYEALVLRLRTVYAGAIVLVASADLDQVLFRTLASRLRLPMVGVNTPIQQAVDILGNADAYIGGRWHASIFALRGGTPLIALSSQTFKMQALAGLAGSPPPLDTLNLCREAPALTRHLTTMLEEGGALRSRLRASADQMAAGCWDNVAYLGAWDDRGEPS
jgi:hypothetical protein